MHVVRSEQLEPDSSGLASAIRELGYTFDQAIADLIDNSIEADALQISVGFVRDNSSLLRIEVCDDGVGMSEETLKDAMVLGRRRTRAHGPKRLGKFGMGLKTASLSQADSVTVLSRHAGRSTGRRWTVEGMKDGWKCDVFDPAEVDAELPAGFGTVVRLERLDEFKVAPAFVDGKVGELTTKLLIYLGLHFHRFLEAGLVITLESYNIETGQTGPPRTVSALDPFGYKKTGARGYPQQLRLSGDLSDLIIEAHVWPTNSNLPGYRLGGGVVAERQGHYFYRNDRLIQAGGWNGLRSDTETHLSLGRVRIELGEKHDEMFSLNLQKTSVDVPDAFTIGMSSATTETGATFKDYIRKAEGAYRTAVATGRALPVVPGKGLPAGLRHRIAKRLVGGRGNHSAEVTIGWRRLRGKRFFQIDVENETIELNQHFREIINGHGPASAADAPLVKTLLFLLLRDQIPRERSSKKNEELLEKYQAALYEAAVAEQKRQEK